MAGQDLKEPSATKNLKETTPLLTNDLENAYGTTSSVDAPQKKHPPQTLWEWAKAEIACYSKKVSEEWDRINRYGPNHQSPQWKDARSSRYV